MSVGVIQQFVKYRVLSWFSVLSQCVQSHSVHIAPLTSSILHPLLDKYKACSHPNSTFLHVHALLKHEHTVQQRLEMKLSGHSYKPLVSPLKLRIVCNHCINGTRMTHVLDKTEHLHKVILYGVVF
jgi:hypothetical protein